MNNVMLRQRDVFSDCGVDEDTVRRIGTKIIRSHLKDIHFSLSDSDQDRSHSPVTGWINYPQMGQSTKSKKTSHALCNLWPERTNIYRTAGR